MKKLLIAAAALVTVSTAAQADTVTIINRTVLQEPHAVLTSSTMYPFQGTKEIVLTTMGKTCTWIGSASAGGPKGCNYGITVNTSTGELSNPTSDSNTTCTPVDQLIAACK